MLILYYVRHKKASESKRKEDIFFKCPLKNIKIIDINISSKFIRTIHKIPTH